MNTGEGEDCCMSYRRLEVDRTTTSDDYHMISFFSFSISTNLKPYVLHSNKNEGNMKEVLLVMVAGEETKETVGE